MAKDEALILNRIGDAAVERATGRGWSAWLKFLDGKQAAKLTHPQIFDLVEAELDRPWWSQMVAVGYEQARGLREPNQRRGAGYQVSVTRTVPLSAARAFAAFHDPKRRAAWLDAELELRTATKPRSLRFTFAPERGAKASLVLVGIVAKGEGRAQVAVGHENLPAKADVERMRKLWKAALERLAAPA